MKTSVKFCSICQIMGHWPTFSDVNGQRHWLTEGAVENELLIKVLPGCIHSTKLNIANASLNKITI